MISLINTYSVNTKITRTGGGLSSTTLRGKWESKSRTSFLDQDIKHRIVVVCFKYLSKSTMVGCCARSQYGLVSGTDKQ